jgi:hypothetical protein
LCIERQLEGGKLGHLFVVQQKRNWHVEADFQVLVDEFAVPQRPLHLQIRVVRPTLGVAAELVGRQITPRLPLRGLAIASRRDKDQLGPLEIGNEVAHFSLSFHRRVSPQSVACSKSLSSMPFKS